MEIPNAILASDVGNNQTGRGREMGRYATYYVCMVDDATEAYGTKHLKQIIKGQKELGNPVVEIWKHGKDFENNHDDIINVTDSYLRRV